MLLQIVNFVTDSTKTALTSLGSAAVGTAASAANHVTNVNTAFQHAAWTVAIIAGVLTTINLFFPLRTWYDRRHKKLP
jgi:dihydrodipicolinate synthase/N-acetylneuraminate lyase